MIGFLTHVFLNLDLVAASLPGMARSFCPEIVWTLMTRNSWPAGSSKQASHPGRTPERPSHDAQEALNLMHKTP